MKWLECTADCLFLVGTNSDVRKRKGKRLFKKKTVHINLTYERFKLRRDNKSPWTSQAIIFIIFITDKPIGASPRWQFLFWEEKGAGATDFREGRNPPQAEL